MLLVEVQRKFVVMITSWC